MPLLLQLVLTGVWASTVVMHTMRLFRLARVAQLRNWEEGVRLRSGLSRVWWWLGKPEFWNEVMHDCLKAIEITLIIYLIAVGLSGA